jgi:hypothetical protein
MSPRGSYRRHSGEFKHQLWQTSVPARLDAEKLCAFTACLPKYSMSPSRHCHSERHPSYTRCHKWPW